MIDSEVNVLVIVGMLVLVPNIIASVMALKAFFLVKERRKYQLWFIWLVPVFGSLLIIYSHKEDFFKRKRSRIGNHPDYNSHIGSDEP